MSFVYTIKSLSLHKRTRLFFKLAIPICIFYYLYTILDLAVIKKLLTDVKLSIFLLSFIFLCFRNIIGAYRSSILLKYKQLHYSISVLSRYYFIGNFFNLFLPSVIGRDIARGYYLYNSSSGKKETISAIVVERFIGTVALMVLSLFSYVLAIFLGIDVITNDIIQFIICVFFLGCIFIVLIFNKKTEHFIERLIPVVAGRKLRKVLEFIHDVITYNKVPGILWQTLVISVLFQFFGVISTFLIACSLESTVQFVIFLILLPVIWVVGMLPISIGGLGVREGSFVFLFGAVGMKEEMAMAICILWLVQNIGLGLIGGLLFILEGGNASKMKTYRNEINK